MPSRGSGVRPTVFSWVATHLPCHFGRFAAMAPAMGAGWSRPIFPKLNDSRRGVRMGGVSDRPIKDDETCRFTSMFSSRVRNWLRPRSMRSRKTLPKSSKTMAERSSRPRPGVCVAGLSHRQESQGALCRARHRWPRRRDRRARASVEHQRGYHPLPDHPRR